MVVSKLLYFTGNSRYQREKKCSKQKRQLISKESWPKLQNGSAFLHLLLLLLIAICLLNFYSSWESQDLKTVYCRVRQLKYRADGKNFSC